MTEIDKTQKSVQNATLVVILLTNFVASFAITSLNIAVPHIGVEFGASTTSLTWIVLAFLLVTSVLSIPFGRLSDIRGRGKIFKVGLLLFFVASFLIIFSPNMMTFLFMRILQGVGSAMIFATSTAILVEAFPPNKRGSVLGISIACVYIGSSIGPVLGGFVTSAFSWRAVFVLISAVALASFIMAIVRSPKTESVKNDGETIKTSSVILFVISFGLLMLGIATFMQNIWSYFVLTAGIVLVIIYIKMELRRETPLLEVKLFKGNRVLSFSLLAGILNYAAMFAITYLMSLYLQLARGFTADISGLIMISQPIVQAILSPIAGKLSDKRSPATLASLGMACCAAALLMFAFLNEQTPIPYIITGLLLTGVGIAFFSPPNQNIILGSVSNNYYGIATSLNSAGRAFGQVIGMAVLTIVIRITIGDIPIAEVRPSEFIYNSHISFIVFAAICAIGVFISLQRREEKSTTSPIA